jgi:hypothetical protein
MRTADGGVGSCPLRGASDCTMTFGVKTIMMNAGRRATETLLPLLCAGLFALSLGGCAEAYYTYDYYTPDYGYRTYYGPDYYPYYPYYSYYGGVYYYSDWAG